MNRNEFLNMLLESVNKACCSVQVVDKAGNDYELRAASGESGATFLNVYDSNGAKKLLLFSDIVEVYFAY